MTELQRDIFDSAFTGTYKMVSSLLATGTWYPDDVEDEIKNKFRQFEECIEKGMIDTALKFMGTNRGLRKALTDYRK